VAYFKVLCRYLVGGIVKNNTLYWLCLYWSQPSVPVSQSEGA